MASQTALGLRVPDEQVQLLMAREAALAQRESELADYLGELQQIQARYLEEIGPYYADLGRLEAELATAEIRAGLRAPAEAPPPPDPDEAEPLASGCSNPAAPSSDLKRIFRDLARTIHPDLADDESARCRRHSLMAEANRAYAERDADRLRLILRAWEQSPEAVAGDDPASDRLRLQRRLAEIDERLVLIESEFSDLRGSAIGRLERRISEARGQGWDLFAEMLVQVRSEIGRVERRLTRLQAAGFRPQVPDFRG